MTNLLVYTDAHLCGTKKDYYGDWLGTLAVSDSVDPTDLTRIYHWNGCAWPRIPMADPGYDIDMELSDTYEFHQLDYLDSPKALKMFELQADIICENGFQSIIDVGSRHGPVLDILKHRGYITPEFRYMGFDSSPEPIELAQATWSHHPNIEFRVASWFTEGDICTDWQPDVTIWSGVICYVERNRRLFFEYLQHNIWNCRHAIIQEPTIQQEPHKVASWLKLPHAQPDIDAWITDYDSYQSWIFDMEIFMGRRKTWLVWT